MSSPRSGKRVKPIEDVLPSAELLQHYRRRIEEFEQERNQLLEAVERCAVHQEEVHRLEWENRKRVDEIQELQRALSDAQQFLFEERQRLLSLQAENDELKLQEHQDRKRIQQLLSLAQPLEQEVTFGAGSSDPTSLLLPAGAAGATARQQQQQQQQGTAPGGSTAAGAAPRSGANVLRTVFMPSVDTDFLLLKVESLEAQLNEQRQLHEERVASLLADRKVVQQEAERHAANFRRQVEALTGKVTSLEDMLRATTQQYISARREKQEAEALAAAAQAQMTAEVSAAMAEAADVKKVARVEAERLAVTSDNRMKEYVAQFRDQVRAREEELKALASLHTSSKAAAEERIDELEGRVAKLKEANRSLELRRQLDVDGWTADVTLLRKQMAAVDRKLLQMRLIDRLEDDDRLDALLDQLERRAPTVAPPGSKKKPAAGAGALGAGSSKRSRPKGAAGAGASSSGAGVQQPMPTGGSDDGSSVSGMSVKSALQHELRAVRERIHELELRASRKAQQTFA